MHFGATVPLHYIQLNAKMKMNINISTVYDVKKHVMMHTLYTLKNIHIR